MLVLDHVYFRYGAFTVLDDISSSVGEGELLYVTGPNGAGKSTLLKLISGILYPERGTISWHSSETDKPHHPSFYKEYSYLDSETNGLLLALDAWQNLAFWTRLHGQELANDEIAKALAHWGLDHPVVASGLVVEKFSTGMKRRLALARLALWRQRLWILDEPCNGLDQAGQQMFGKLIKDHLNRGGTAVVVSHGHEIFNGSNVHQLSL